MNLQKLELDMSEQDFLNICHQEFDDEGFAEFSVKSKDGELISFEALKLEIAIILLYKGIPVHVFEL